MSNVNNKKQDRKTPAFEPADYEYEGPDHLKFYIERFKLYFSDHKNEQNIRYAINSDPDLKELIKLNDQAVRGKTSGHGKGNKASIHRLIFRIGMHSLGEGLLANYDAIELMKIGAATRHELRHLICKIHLARHEHQTRKFYHHLKHQNALYFFHIFLDGLLKSLLAISPPEDNPDFDKHHYIALALLNDSLRTEWHDSLSEPDDLYPENPYPPPAPFPDELVTKGFWHVQ